MVSKSSFYHLVIEEFDKLNNKHISERDLFDYLSNNEVIKFFSFIKHDKDINFESGELDRVHYHVSLVLSNPYSKNTILNDVSSHLLVNRNIVSSRFVKDFIKSTQYLIHKNDKDKYQYDLLDIWTNDTNEVMNIICNSISSYDIEIDYLIELIRNSSSLSIVYKELGLKKARTYHSIITDLWKEKYHL